MLLENFINLGQCFNYLLIDSANIIYTLDCILNLNNAELFYYIFYLSFIQSVLSNRIAFLILEEWYNSPDLKIMFCYFISHLGFIESVVSNHIAFLILEEII